MNKRKIVNDPVYGFINIPSSLLYDLIEHPYMQRLRRIRQLGLTYLVYPGANHTRFQHALGAMHLMDEALRSLQWKGTEISSEEYTGALAAILLHDVGHCPFSHTMEGILLPGVKHEYISLLLMEELNKEFGGALDRAIRIFTKEDKPYLCQLVSGQLDMDRMDYLRRDSFFSGVTEGIIGSDRLIKMLQVRDNQLFMEAKGIYSIEKFLLARRLMYWQVYLHKTVIAADQLLLSIFERARLLIRGGMELSASPALLYFLRDYDPKDLEESRDVVLDQFCMLDDDDINLAIKQWTMCGDAILSDLSRKLYLRHLPHIEITNEPYDEGRIEEIREAICKRYGLKDKSDAGYYLRTGVLHTDLYSNGGILVDNRGELQDLAKISDIGRIFQGEGNVCKYYLCYPKGQQAAF